MTTTTTESIPAGERAAYQYAVGGELDCYHVTQIRVDDEGYVESERIIGEFWDTQAEAADFLAGYLAGKWDEIETREWEDPL